MFFDETEISGVKMKNRLVRSATWEGMCDEDGRPKKSLRSCYQTLAKGEVGLIITGFAFVTPEGKQLPGKMGIATDDFAVEMKELAAAVHDEGGKICMQLVHAGGQASRAAAGRRPLAPSAVSVDQYPEEPEELTTEGIAAIVEAFGRAAGRAKDYGFDAVQLHGAHGYLINEFLSPLTNRRSDAYGGGIANRCRFLMETYDRIRREVGNDFPVMIKLSGSDNLEGGFSAAEALVAASLLDGAGIDAIEVSSGTPASGKMTPARVKIDSPDKEAYNLSLAREMKKKVSCPVMAVGGIRSLDVAEKAFQEGAVDYVAMSRPLIREPGLARRWREGDVSPARCISCNGCFRPGLKGEGIYCVKEKEEKEKG